MKKFELPEQPKITNTAKDFTVAKEAISNLDKFDYAWKSYSHKLERRFIAAIKYIEEIEQRLKECDNLRIEANNQAAMEYSLKCEVVEERAELKRETEKLKSQLAKQQPEIPEFVTELIKYAKENGKTIRWCLYGNCKELYPQAAKWIGADDDIEFTEKTREQQEIFVHAWLNDYTVAKEKRFYLKHKSVLIFDPDIDDSDVDELYLGAGGNFVPYPHLAKIFTQQEIDSMETGSYEQIEVGDD